MPHRRARQLVQPRHRSGLRGSIANFLSRGLLNKPAFQHSNSLRRTGSALATGPPGLNGRLSSRLFSPAEHAQMQDALRAPHNTAHHAGAHVIGSVPIKAAPSDPDDTIYVGDADFGESPDWMRAPSRFESGALPQDEKPKLRWVWLYSHQWVWMVGWVWGWGWGCVGGCEGLGMVGGALGWCEMGVLSSICCVIP